MTSQRKPFQRPSKVGSMGYTSVGGKAGAISVAKFTFLADVLLYPVLDIYTAP